MLMMMMMVYAYGDGNYPCQMIRGGKEDKIAYYFLKLSQNVKIRSFFFARSSHLYVVPVRIALPRGLIIFAYKCLGATHTHTACGWRAQ